MKELKLNREQANRLQGRIVEVLGCEKTIVSATREEPTVEPRPGLESNVLCKKKQEGVPVNAEINDYCAVINGSLCPLGLPIDKVSTENLD